MKIIVCGPPHSGKSVFVASLERLLPSDGYETIRVHKDGEGDWSNNPNQKQVKDIIRKSNECDKDFIKSRCKIIKKSNKPIVLVDIGGMLFPDKIPIFKICDSFIVLSSDKIHRKEWKVFGEYFNSKCIAELESNLNAEDFIEKNENGFVKGIVGKLERGTWHEKSPVLISIADEIIRKSGYLRTEKKGVASNIIDFNKIAEKLNCGTERIIDGKKIFTNINFSYDKAIEIKKILSNYKKQKSYRLDGARANWISALSVEVLVEKRVEKISVYDTVNRTFIAIKKLSVSDNVKNIKCNVLVSENSVFIDFNLINETILHSDLEKISLPKIDESKIFFISGRIPHWLLNSISLSYSNSEKYVFQGGKGFICYKSKDDENLGHCKQMPDGIDIEKYFEEQKHIMKQ